jgi:beta-propeller repeat-containing protein/centrosomal CEP192-like protein
MNVETRLSAAVKRAICLLFGLLGCALTALTLFPTATRDQNVTSPPTVRAKPHRQVTGGSRATTPNRKSTGIAGTKRVMPAVAVEPTSKARVIESFGKLPLSFEANQGQADQQVKFLSRGHGYRLFLTANEAVLALKSTSAIAAPSMDQKPQFKDLLLSPKAYAEEHENQTARPQPLPSTTVRMKLVGANRKASVIGLDELPGKSNYFVGKDPKKWRQNVSTYAKVRYKNVYPGVDLIYHGNRSQLEYDFVAAPGTDVSTITMEVEALHAIQEKSETAGEIPIRINSNGNLILDAKDGQIILHKPVAYQNLDSRRRMGKTYVDARYVVKGKNRIGLEVGAYDAGEALIIDPILSYSTYLGGSLDDFGTAVAVDGSGSAYVTGGTTSTDFPITSGVYQSTYAGADGGYQGVSGDIFVTKLSPDGASILWSTYIGGSGDDNSYSIAVDPTGVYLTGGTNSSDYPVTSGAWRPTTGVGLTDVFVTKLDPTGSALLYSTHIGVSGEGIRGFSIAVDGGGNAYVAGGAGPGFPTTAGAFQTSSFAFSSGFVMKLNPSGSAAVYSTFLSGGNFSDVDYAESVAVDQSGNAYATGYAGSSTFPITAGAFQNSNAGAPDAFVTVLNSSGSALLYSTYLGGTGSDQGSRIAVDPSGMAYVTGATASINFPTTSGAFQTVYGGGNTDAFIAKFDTTKSGSASLVYSTYLGGSGDDNGQPLPPENLAVDDLGNAYVTGGTSSTDFPTVHPVQATLVGGYDAYIAKLNASGSALVYSTYLGGSGDDIGRGIAVDSGGNVYVTGQTTSSDFSVTSNSFQSAFGGSTDAFVTKLVPIAFVAPTSLTFPSLAVGSTSAAQTFTVTNEQNTALNLAITTTGDFAETDTCGTSLGPNLSCTVSVTFVPTFPLTRTGSVTITDNAVNSPQTVMLSGIGVGPAVIFGQNSFSVGTQLITTSSPAQMVSLTNAGNAPLTISSIGIGGTNSGDFSQTNTCPASGATLAANASCSINLIFTPSDTGSRTASVTVADNAPGTPQSLGLVGTGTDFAIAAASGTNCPVGGNCLTAATIKSGQSARYDLQVTPNSGFNGTVALTCTGAPMSSTCSVSPASVTVNGSTGSAFMVTVSNASSAMLIPFVYGPSAPRFPVAVAAFVPLFLLASKLILRINLSHRRLVRVLATVGLAIFMATWLLLSGCGGGAAPPTNATLTITGASGGLNRTLPLSLTVNH